MAKYEFAIREQELGSGQVLYTPVCRKKPISRFLLINPPWERITRIYNKYVLMDLHFDPDLTYNECQEHIEGFKEQLEREMDNQVVNEKLHTLEEKNLTFDIKHNIHAKESKFKVQRNAAI